MLEYLHIENIAVIEQTGIDFREGLNVLTGETGAGKSIIIDAINAVLGERTSKELIRAGCKNAVVSAVFSHVSEDTKAILSENGFQADTDGNFVIQRTLSQSSGTIRLNGQPVASGVLRSFSHRLINIHGQHDNQALLDPANHYHYLDMLAENSAILQAYQEEFRHFNALRSRLKELDCDEDEKQRRMDLLTYQIRELESVDIHPGEYETLKAKLLSAKNCEKQLKRLDDALFCLNGDDERIGALSQLGEAIHAIGEESLRLPKDETAGFLSAVEVVRAFKDALQDYRNDLLSASEDLDALQDRVECLRDLMRKYGDSEEKMLAFLENAKEQLEAIAFNDEETARLEEALQASQGELIRRAERLTQSRLNASKDFESKVTSVLEQLNMAGVRLQTEFIKGRYTAHGCDEIQFLIGTNAGEEVKPLSRIASGGELSRMMLAIKSVLSDKDDVDTLIFDEIDAGISGRTADRVGVQLRRVAGSRQVICVTHLAQIAATASHHLLIEKSIRDGRTYTDVTELNGQKRVEELARIMGGSNVTDGVREAAAELLHCHETTLSENDRSS